MTQPALPLRHLLLALAVVFIWGTNFVVIKLALHDLPPLLFAGLRFTFVVLPALFFVKRPAVPWRQLASYGVLIGAGQFGGLYVAMTHFITPGLASLVVQTQVFFTIALSMRLAGERVQPFQWGALLLASCGLGLILWHTDGTTTPLGLLLVVIAALSWASGNMVAKHSGKVDMVAYVVWASVFSIPPLLLLSLVLEGPVLMAAGLQRATAVTWAAVLWQSFANSLFGYAAWGWLLARYPAATITPMALLVPVFGMAASAWWLHEPLPHWKLLAAALVLGGLAVNLLWPKLTSRKLPA
jgi:O-acetylserine/cysteine efflux transporter